MPFYFKFRHFDRHENRKMFCQEDGCGLSNIMKHSLEKWPECDKILRNFFSGLERGNQALKPQGEWGGNGEDKKN